MNTTPDSWVMVRVDTVDKGPYYKIFGSWSGGYLDGDSWRMNSGVESVTEDDDYYYFKGLSGSVYQCHKKGYGIRSVFNMGILNSIIEKAGENAKVMNEDTDFMSVDYGEW